MTKKLVTSETMPTEGCFIVIHTEEGRPLKVYGEYKWHLNMLFARAATVNGWSVLFLGLSLNVCLAATHS